MDNVVRYSRQQGQLEKYVTKIADQRKAAVARLIMEPSAENAGKVRELNGQLWGMMAVINCIEDYVKANQRKILFSRREIIEKSL